MSSNAARRIAEDRATNEGFLDEAGRLTDRGRAELEARLAEADEARAIGGLIDADKALAELDKFTDEA
ncbi:MAG: hypothetical protein HUU21_38070 [Polyangiaceae bacterium]|nr:hypothetical protein [Polyangiaceae bacterium]